MQLKVFIDLNSPLILPVNYNHILSILLRILLMVSLRENYMMKEYLLIVMTNLNYFVLVRLLVII